MRSRAALGALALLAALVGGGGWLLERQAGLHPARALAGGAAGSGAPSGAWYCPHGGGAGECARQLGPQGRAGGGSHCSDCPA